MSTVPSYNRKAETDPTRTKTIRKRYAQNIRGWFGRLNATIRDAVVSRNVFAINEEDPSDPPVFAFPRDSQKTDRFMDWLREQERKGVLDIINRNGNTYIRASYQRGIQHANRALEEEGVTVNQSDLESLFNMPVHADAVQRLYTRNFEELSGITEAMNQQISRELADGFAEGHSPYKIADNITDRVNKIGKTRATVLARTEVIRAHSDATLNRFEQMGIDEITIKAEWETAGDSRVCPLCQTLEGKTYTIEQARSATFTFDGSEFPVQPPAHPQCRCALLPVTSSNTSGQTRPPVSESPDPLPASQYVNDELEDEWLEQQAESRASIFPEDADVKETTRNLVQAASEPMDELMENAQIKVRAPVDAVEEIVDDGRFKTQFETKTSGGQYAPDDRRKLEKKLFGYDEDTPDEERPIYGYVRDRTSDEPDGRFLDGYGGAEFRLTEEAKDRATFTYGDSLAANPDVTRGGKPNVIPSPVKDPNPRSADVKALQKIADGDVERPGDNSYYTEAQIHEGVTMEDVDEVVFQALPSDSIQSTLDDADIDWRVK